MAQKSSPRREFDGHGRKTLFPDDLLVSYSGASPYSREGRVSKDVLIGEVGRDAFDSACRKIILGSRKYLRAIPRLLVWACPHRGCTSVSLTIDAMFWHTLVPGRCACTGEDCEACDHILRKAFKKQVAGTFHTVACTFGGCSEVSITTLTRIASARQAAKRHRSTRHIHATHYMLFDNDDGIPETMANAIRDILGGGTVSIRCIRNARSGIRNIYPFRSVAHAQQFLNVFDIPGIVVSTVEQSLHAIAAHSISKYAASVYATAACRVYGEDVYSSSVDGAYTATTPKPTQQCALFANPFGEAFGEFGVQTQKELQIYARTLLYARPPPRASTGKRSRKRASRGKRSLDDDVSPAKRENTKKRPRDDDDDAPPAKRPRVSAPAKTIPMYFPPCGGRPAAQPLVCYGFAATVAKFPAPPPLRPPPPPRAPLLPSGLRYMPFADDSFDLFGALEAPIDFDVILVE